MKVLCRSYLYRIKNVCIQMRTSDLSYPKTEFDDKSIKIRLTCFPLRTSLLIHHFKKVHKVFRAPSDAYIYTLTTRFSDFLQFVAKRKL